MSMAYLGSLAINASNVLVVFLVSVILARIMSVEEYGNYFIAITILTLAGAPITQGLSALLIRESAKFSLGELLSGLYRWAMFASLGFSVLAAFLFLMGIGMFGSPEMLSEWPIFLGVFVYYSMQGLITIHSSFLRGKGCVVLGLFYFILSRNVLFALIITSVFFAKIATELEFVDVIIINIMAGGLVALISWVYYKKKISLPAFSHYPDESKQWGVVAWSFSLIAGIQLLNQNIDFLLLGWQSGAEVAGLYKPALQIASLVAFALTSINIVLHTRIASLYKARKITELQEAINQAGKLGFMITAALFVCIIFFSEFAVTRLFGEAFSAAATPIIILAIGQLVNAFIGPVAALLNMTGQERITIKVLALSVVINFMLCVLLIPLLGMNGAALAAATSMMVWNLILYFKAKQLTTINTLLWVSQLWRRGV